MWLLNFHIAFSVLCLVTGIGFAAMFKEEIRKNGWMVKKERKKGNKLKILYVFVPLMNILFVIGIFITITTKKEETE